MNPASFLGSVRTSPCVKQVVGVSGSGKTVYLNRMLRAAIKSSDFQKLHRFIVVDVKHDGYHDLVEYPAQTAGGAIKQLTDERLVVVHPSIEEAPFIIDELIGWLFDTAQRLGEEFSATLVIEESSTYIGSHAGSIPDSIKRYATQGRSLGLSIILVNQRSLGNRWTDTQSDALVLFRLAIPDADMLRKRWGVNHDELNERLASKKFSFAVYDLEELDLKYYAPVEYSEGGGKPVRARIEAD